MFSKPMFVTGLKNTGLYVLALFPFFVLLPLALSALLAEVKSKKASSFYQAVFFMPTMLAFSIICMYKRPLSLAAFSSAFISAAVTVVWVMAMPPFWVVPVS